MNRINLWFALGLAIVLGVLWQFYPLQNASLRINSLPLTGPNFVGEEVPLSTTEKEFFKDVGLIKRLYKIDNQLFLVTALDGTKNRHAVHDPYYCFRGTGWEIISNQEFKMPRGSARLVELRQGDKRKVLFIGFLMEKKATALN